MIGETRTMNAQFVRLDVDAGIASVTLNRPGRLNAVSPQLVSELHTAIGSAIGADPRVIVLRGSGRAFCAGHDLKEAPLDPTSPEARENLGRIQGITGRLRAANAITIAAVQGYALGAGLEFALSCDFIVAGADARFAFPEVKVGLSATGGITYLLSQAIGLPRAKELMLLGAQFGPVEAHSWGLVNRVAADGELESEVEGLIAAVCAQPQASLALAKHSLEAAHQTFVESAMEREIGDAIETLVSPIDAASPLSTKAAARRAEE